MNQEIIDLKNRIEKLERAFTPSGADNQITEFIRDVVIFDADSKSTIPTTATTVVTSVNFGASSTTTTPINTASAPNLLLRVYYRGKAYNIPAYNIS